MSSFHDATFDLLGTRPPISTAAIGELERTERRLGIRLPPAVREWYSHEDALSILAAHSNNDPPIPISEFALTESPAGRLLPIRWENQGVCTWAIQLDGSDDPPVLVDVDSGGAEWRPHAPRFSTYVYTCVWDYQIVFRRLTLVQAQDNPVGPETLHTLAGLFDDQPGTSGWPGNAQHRFAGAGHGILIWSSEGQADWFVGAADAASLEAALQLVWDLDGVGWSLYACSKTGRDVLARLRADA